MFLTNRLFISLIAPAFVCALGYFWSFFVPIGLVLLAIILILLLCDSMYLFLYSPVECKRNCPTKFSNGDNNELSFTIRNPYSRKVFVNIIDELPIEFQVRDFSLSVELQPNETKKTTYFVRPTTRGAYKFGNTNLYVKTSLGLAERRVVVKSEFEIAVLPSLRIVRNMNLLSVANLDREYGMKPIRRTGSNTEFDKIRGTSTSSFLINVD